MTPTIRLGKLFGIQIGFNWSLVFVFALIAWTLASAVLPAQVPNQPVLAYWVTGLIGALIFYGCLLAHELAHAIVARRSGVKVAGITLWLFGGVSQLEGEPQSPGAEALITAVGPLTSLVVAAVAFALALAMDAVAAPALASYLLIWLAVLNLALAIFNLLPAFPLDGGRLLSSFFWWRTGTRQRGVHHAVRVGRIVAALMIALGVVELLLGAVLSGIWIAFIGWFLLSAASAEESATETRKLLKSVSVAEAMTSPVVTVPDWITIEDFVQSVAHQHRFTTYPLRNPAGQLTGVVRLQELLRALSSSKGGQRLRDVAQPISEVLTARPEENLEQLLERAGSAFQHRVLVFDGDRLVGILSPADVSRIIALRQALASHPNVAA